IQQEYSKVILQAGYENGAFGVIFQGDIKQIRRGRENNVDTYLDILAADGDAAYNNAVVSKSIAAGSRPSDRVNAVLEAMTPQGVTPGFVPDNFDAGGTLPRGKVLYGMGRDFLSDVAATRRCSWSIQAGQLVMTPIDTYRPGDAVVLSAATGMVGL